MGKPSKLSRKNGIIRLRHRKRLEKLSYTKQIKEKEIEISDLQIEVQKLSKFIEEAGRKVICEFNKSEREQKNLLKWIDIYTKQISDLEKKIYLADLKNYISENTSRPSQPSPSRPSQSPPLLSPPLFKTMDEYFKFEGGQVILLLLFFFRFNFNRKFYN
jgi:hypothetical protein